MYYNVKIPVIVREVDEVGDEAKALTEPLLVIRVQADTPAAAAQKVAEGIARAVDSVP